MAGLAESLVVFSILAFVAFLIWNRTRANLERRRLQLDAQAQLLEKIGSGQALTEFLKTDQGNRFWDLLTAPESASKDARTRIFALTTMGLIALFAGFVFIMAVLIPTLGTSGPPGTETRLAIYLPVFLLTGAGVGALVAAWIMHRLSRKWGMLGAEAPDDAAD